MKRLNCKISIGTFSFTYVHDVTIESTWQTFTDTATIKLPKSLQYNGRDLIAGDDPIFKRGDAVKIELGYFPNLNTEFEGFISNLRPSLPIEIMCEDATFLLKQTNFNKSYRTVNLKTLIADIVKESSADLQIEADDIELGKFRVTDANAVEVLEELKNTYGIYSYIQNGTLFSGLPYRVELQDDVKYDLEKNVIESKELTYSRNDDQRLKVKAISITDNSRIEIEVGDKDGEARTLYFYGLSAKELEDTANREIERIKSAGLQGSFNTFGEPFAQHNDVSVISSVKTPEKAGNYLIKRVVTSFGVKGFRRQIEPDRKI